MSVRRTGIAPGRPTWTAQFTVKPSAGLRILIPGYAQWSWRQRERALVLFVSFAAALAVGLFAWGTRTGVAVLAFAFGTHVLSVVDVLKQSAFPGFGRWMPLASASGGLALGVYAPTLALATLVAWPVAGGGPLPDGYLVNFWAYRQSEPKRSDWVWVRPSPWSAPRVGRIVAGPGEMVEWSDKQLHVNGREISPAIPFRSAVTPDELSFVVPRGYLLINPTADAAQASPLDGLILVERSQVKGKAWAQVYPVWNRRLLP